MNNLASMKYDDVPAFSLHGHTVTAKVVDCHDGDTFKAIFSLPDTMTVVRFTCRIQGIDSPEIRPRLNVPNRDILIRKAVDARNMLCSLVTNCTTPLPSTSSTIKSIIDKENTLLIKLELGNWDKYGRLLCIPILADGSLVTDILKEKNMVMEYYGGTKKTAEEQLQWTLTSSE